MGIGREIGLNKVVMLHAIVFSILLATTPAVSRPSVHVFSTRLRQLKCMIIQIPARKLMMIILFDFQGFLHQHGVPQSQTVTSNYYNSVLIIMFRHLKRNWPQRIMKEAVKALWIAFLPLVFKPPSNITEQSILDSHFGWVTLFSRKKWSVSEDLLQS